MARLPDMDTLGARPTPVSRRSIAANPRAGAVGQAVAQFGDRLNQTGRVMQEKEDRLTYATAKTEFLKRITEARQRLETDPNFETWEARFGEEAKTARAEAAKMIGSRSDRALFESDAELDIVRSSGELATRVRGRVVDRDVAAAVERLDEMQDLAQDATDDSAREAVIGNASELIAGLQARGYITAEDAGKRRRDWTQSYIVQRIETLRNAEDFEGATSFFEANRGRLDPATESRTFALLTDATSNRESLILAQGFVYGATEEATPTTAPTQPTRGRHAGERDVERELSSAGYSDAVVSGFLGNFSVEGGYGGARGDGGTASGIAQWREERRDNFRRMFGKEPHQASAAEQARFVVWEMNNPQAAGMTVAQRDAILAAKTPEEAARLIDQNYERSSGKHRSRREQAAREYAGGTAEQAQRRDLRDIYTRIDERAEVEGWTPEKTERIKSQAATLVQREDVLRNREQDDSYEAALAKAEELGQGFTDPSQLGDAYYRASEQQQVTLRNMAEANAEAMRRAAEPEPVKSDGDVVRSLHRMAIEAPGDFARRDLRPYRPFMTPAEFDEISTSQARVKEDQGEWSPRTGIQSAITWGKDFGGVEIEDDTDRFRVYHYMDDRARQFRGETKGREPAESDYQRWFREASREVTIKRSFAGVDALAGDVTVRAFEGLTEPFRKMITRNIRAVKGPSYVPSEAEIQQWFERMGEPIR